MDRPIRVLMAIPGLSSHDLGAREVALACRHAGMEVIFLYRRGLSNEEIAQTMVEEDADVLGLSMHSGAHLTVVPKVIDAVRRAGADDRLLLLGGIIPPAHVPALKEMGVHEVFGPGTPTAEIVAFIKIRVAERRAQTAEASPG
jgi:methylmalonyl-CoA mutase C-terminal domain/subunit